MQSVVSLGDRLGQEIVAEGVEHPGQLQILRALGVRKIQGYLFSEPFPSRELSAARLRECLGPLDPAVAAIPANG